MPDTEEFQIGLCESGLAACKGGQRRVREYEDRGRTLLICDRCWPHRKRAPGRKRKKEVKR